MIEADSSRTTFVLPYCIFAYTFSLTCFCNGELEPCELLSFKVLKWTVASLISKTIVNVDCEQSLFFHIE